ncbi:MAG: hypothetical protein JWQ04_905, partial [Pedosphaera sp.]|nr:hypothetical protein [Pedosphaera sp.]
MGPNPTAKNPAPQNSADAWFTPGRFALLLGLLIAVCFPLVLGGFETFYAVDFGTFGYPVASFQRDCFWAGELPLWNPYSSCGMPFLAQWNTMTLYPLSLFYLLFPLSWSLGVFCLGHIFLAGLGMYFLARRWTGSQLAAALAGTAFAFNGLTWFGLMWPNNIAALGWMPWVVLTMESAWGYKNEPQPRPFDVRCSMLDVRCFPPSFLTSGRAIILAALAGAMQMLSGAPEVILQTWLIIAALWLVQFFRGNIPRWPMLLRTLGIGALVAGLSAAQLLPFLSLLSHSQRDTQFGSSLMLAMPAYGWANYLVPLFHCFHSPQGVLIQPMQGWTGSYYSGVAIVALALLAAWRARSQRTWLLAALLVFSLTMALGSNFFVYPAVQKLMPLIGFMRFPIKFVVLATFAFPLLAACGLKWLLATTPKDWPREWKNLLCLAAGLLAAIVLILFFAWKYPLGSDDVPGTIVNGFLRAIFLGLTLGCLVLIHREKETRRQRLWQTGLILLLWFDVFTHAPNLSPTVARAAYAPDTIRQYFKWDTQLRPGVSRALQSKASLLKMLTASSGDPEADTTGRRLSLLMNYNLLDHAAKLDGFYSLDLKEFSEVSRLVNYLTNDSSNLKDFLMISHLSNPTNAVDWITRDSFQPLVTAGQKPVFVTPTNELNALVDGRFDPRH